MAKQSTEQALKDAKEALAELEAAVEEVSPPSPPVVVFDPGPTPAPGPTPTPDGFDVLPPAVAERLRAAMALRGTL